MAFDTSSYAQAAGAPKSLTDYQIENQQVQQNQLALQSNRQKMDEYAQLQGQKNALRNLLSGQTLDLSNPADQAKIYSTAPDLAPGLIKTHQEGLTSAALASKDTAQANQYDAETATKKYELSRQKLDRAMQMVSQSPTPDIAKQHLSELVQHGLMTMQEATAKSQEIDQAGSTPEGYNQWRLGSMAQLMSAHDQFEANKPTLGTRNTGNAIQNTAINPMTGVPTVTASTPMQATPGEVLSAQTQRRGQDLADARAKDALGKPFEVTGADGTPVLVQQDKSGNVTPVAGYTPKAKPAKDVPQTVVTSYTANNTALDQIDAAIDLIKSHKDAMGGWNYLGDSVRQRSDPNGVSTRAKVADIGSLKIHDRSGAAVSISEDARLRPFVPSATDDPEAAVTKLEQLKAEYMGKNQGLADYYTGDQGFKPLPARRVKAAAPAGGVPDDIAAILAKHGTK